MTASSAATTSGTSLPSGSMLGRAAALFRRYDNVLYALFAMWCTLYIASAFYGYMLMQTGGVWSAPLDDVFIHFDYARSFARGYPFQWSEGNGYSSGNTSLTYPMVLALGYWLGFRELSLMVWAATIASVSIYAFLWSSGQLVAHTSTLARDPREGLRWTRFLIPPAVLSMGALDWTLFSGMENAWHLAVWALCLSLALRQSDTDSAKIARRRAWALGMGGALLVATRPESGICVAAFGFYALWRSRDRELVSGKGASLRLLIATALPAVLMLLLQAVLNKAFTSEWSANGAIAKLFLNNPFMTGADKLERYQSLLSYILKRLAFHHFSAIPGVGLIIVALAALPLFSKRLRPVAIMLWVQLVGWLLIVGLNNQLRWHNERYSMPTVAWLLVLAALGAGWLATRATSAPEERHKLWRRSWPLRTLIALGLAGLYAWGQVPRMADQIWFFGRASRNILDQHVTAGLVLKKMGARRILVGDAGAIIYASDRPGLDLIGLGGFHDYPFARSTVHGLGASLELIERIPVDDRPDVMALYPSWWGDMPHRFGRYLTAVPVRGNVICGGSEKVLYRADWTSLDRRGLPRTMSRGSRVVDQLDVADMISERAHSYRYPLPGGYVRYRVLAAPDDAARDLFDAGRILNPGQSSHVRLTLPPGSLQLIMRLAPDNPTELTIDIDGAKAGTMKAEPSGGWQEVSLALPESAHGNIELSVTPHHHPAVLYHLWVVRK